MLLTLGKKGDGSKIRSALEDMDLIDTKRNEIIGILNNLLEETGQALDLIELSSDVIKHRHIHGTGIIEKYLK